MSGSKFSFSDMQNPLFLHPSDNPLSINVTKLEGAGDYRSWKRSMEIQLSSKRKLGFVNGSEVKSTSDAVEAVQWDTCNSMVISWIHNNVSDSIKKSVLFITSASEVWKQLEKRFQLTNGSRKYKLSKELFGLKQNSSSVVDYFTSLSSIWEELDSMNLLPSVKTVGNDVTELLRAIHAQKEEAKLFQFLNGLDDKYSSQRSQLLMLIPLPSVEIACSAIQQEESQHEILQASSHLDNDISAMFTKTTVSADRSVTCGACGGKGHTNDRCWNVIGYPKWHYKYKPPKGSSTGTYNYRGGSPAGKWNNSKQGAKGPVAANVTVDAAASGQPILLSPQQLQQLLQLIPTNAQEPADDMLDSPFSGMIICDNVQAVQSTCDD